MKIALKKLDGSLRSRPSYEEGTAIVTRVTPEAIAAAIEKLGCEADVTAATASEDGPGS